MSNVFDSLRGRVESFGGLILRFNPLKFLQNLYNHLFFRKVITLGKYSLFLIEILKVFILHGVNLKIFFLQVYKYATLSLPIILTAGFFVGMVISLQGYNVLNQFGATSSVGLMSALALIRELGPVITALLFAGRAGSAMTAEIGLMKTTEQLMALEMMAVNPVSYVFIPKFLASVISVPILGLIFVASGIIGAYCFGVLLIKIDAYVFWGQMQETISLEIDVWNSVIKTFIFGVFISWIALYQGVETNTNSEGLSLATTKTVVISSLGILILDFFLTLFMF